MLLNSFKRPTDSLYVEPGTILLREFSCPFFAVASVWLGGKTVSVEEAWLLLVAEGLRCHYTLPDVRRCQQRETEENNEWTK